jgi:hypothetical protein
MRGEIKPLLQPGCPGIWAWGCAEGSKGGEIRFFMKKTDIEALKVEFTNRLAYFCMGSDRDPRAQLAPLFVT